MTGDIFTVAFVVIKMILIEVLVIVCAYGIQYCAKLTEEIKESERNLEEKRRHMLSVLESENKHENGADISQERTDISQERTDISQERTDISQERTDISQESGIVPQEREVEKPYGRIIQLAFYAKKKRIRKKNRKRVYELWTKSKAGNSR